MRSTTAGELRCRRGKGVQDAPVKHEEHEHGTLGHIWFIYLIVVDHWPKRFEGSVVARSISTGRRQETYSHTFVMFTERLSESLWLLLLTVLQ